MFFRKKLFSDQENSSVPEDGQDQNEVREIQRLDTEREQLLKENRRLKEERDKFHEDCQKSLVRIEILDNQKKFLDKMLNDKGYQTLRGFKQVAPLLNQVLGRSFILTVAEEFSYAQAADLEVLNQWIEEAKKIDREQFFCFRDRIKAGHSFRITYSFSSKEYQLMTSVGQRTFHQLMFPEGLSSGLEVNSNNKSAIFLALKERKMQSAVLPAQVFGAPLLSYAFPVFDDEGILIGAVSFSNDITQIVQVGKSLGSIVDSNSDEMLHKLATVLKDELEFTSRASGQLKEESVFTQKTAEYIREKGREVIEIAERLKVLALNTAIEATKVGGSGKGVGIISDQMKMISEATRKTLKEVFDKSVALYGSARKVYDISSNLEQSSGKMKEESQVLFKTSVKITDQKDELASLVRMSIDEIAQDQEDLNAIFMLIQKTK